MQYRFVVGKGFKTRPSMIGTLSAAADTPKRQIGIAQLINGVVETATAKFHPFEDEATER